jgi:hypothetical protein
MCLPQAVESGQTMETGRIIEAVIAGADRLEEKDRDGPMYRLRALIAHRGL